MSQVRKGYARLSLAEKQVAHLERMREPPLRCPACGMETTVADLLAHVAERCPGRAAEPHPHARWVSWRDAIGLGVSEPTMSRWIRRGYIRARGEPQDRRYLLRDLTLRLAERRARRGSVGTFIRESGRRRR